MIDWTGGVVWVWKVGSVVVSQEVGVVESGQRVGAVGYGQDPYGNSLRVDLEPQYLAKI